ncbi:TetR/AcrR family transcriptional regulator [Paenibacillus glycanilyticus]|uniref:TetR family transcriptional regulator n=1 Tax=Paenibacillus glycanilyticus TaxID=126569 RepID=A0ABQ6GBI1_9BACL|nr:TetR family transcriptional regulator [Paenibacillus glycanilyticus]GLX67022.1 TetR family transcriptional regulator [Paenibacillus glycanilyticus]
MTQVDSYPISARWLITEALFSLMAGKSFDKISVDAIVRKAGISRSTFYLHFQDKFDLLQQVTKEITGKLFGIYEGKLGEEQYDTMKLYMDSLPIPATILICEHIRTYETFYRNRFHDPMFLSWLNNELYARFEHIYQNEARSTFAAGGTVGYMGRWLQNGLPGTDLEHALELGNLAMMSLHAATSLTIEK